MRRAATVFTATILAAATVIPVASIARPAKRVKVGTLTCDISAGLGLIIASKKQLTCMYTPAGRGPREVYTGNITKFGLDVGATAGGEMVWSVYAPTTKHIAALSGHYAGATAEATVGAGLGANVLVGGSNRTVALQPVSVQGQTGLNVAVGVAEMTLHPAR